MVYQREDSIAIWQFYQEKKEGKTEYLLSEIQRKMQQFWGLCCGTFKP